MRYSPASGAEVRQSHPAALSIGKGFALGYRRHRLRGFDGEPMRVAHDLLNSVLFFGHGEGDEFRACATGFLLLHKTLAYIVTARHVAEGLGDDPFNIRVNIPQGDHGLFPIDLTQSDEPRLRWFLHQESCADLAILPFPIDLQELNIKATIILSRGVVEQKNPMSDAGCGDMCHIIGLFTMRAGKRRNIPVVHTGHIACLSDSKELIPSQNNNNLVYVEGHLVEVSNLSGLSGAPVFVRTGLELNVPIDGNSTRVVTVYGNEMKLLGVWQGSWDRKLLESVDRVPAGMGIVTPAYRLIELLDSEPVETNRKEWIDHMNSAVAD